MVLTCLAVQAVFTLPAYGDEIVGWGWNNYGQATPPEGNDFIAIAAGSEHSLALKSDGSIVGWGWNNYGQVTPQSGNDFIAVSARGYHSLALKADGSIVGWGQNNYDQATLPDEYKDDNFTAIAAGFYYSLALKTDGSIVGWGRNNHGQRTPPSGDDFIAVAAGRHHSLALKADGSIVAWGYNSNGQATPPEGNNFTAVAAARFRSLALKSDGSIVGWGGQPSNYYGELSHPLENDFTAVAASYLYSLALKIDGSIVGWGYDEYGEATPPEGNNFTAIAAGHHHGLALVSTNSPPVADSGGSYSGYEGYEVTFDGSGSSDPDGDTLTYAWDFGDGTGTTGSSPTPLHTYADNGVYDVCLTVSDPTGASNTQCTTATVANVAPTVGPIVAPVDPVQLGSVDVCATADFVDLGEDDTHTAEWDWGDGAIDSGTVDETLGYGSVYDCHAYTKAGIYTITLTVTDNDGDSGDSQFQYVVVYDPSGGFVTGGGWIDSPSGAYTPSDTDNDDLTGKVGETPYSWVVHSHELYNMGHMYEGAIAYYRATGKDKWLKVSEKNALHINPELERQLDEIIDVIASAQQDDGYLYVSHTCGNPNPHEMGLTIRV